MFFTQNHPSPSSYRLLEYKILERRQVPLLIMCIMGHDSGPKDGKPCRILHALSCTSSQCTSENLCLELITRVTQYLCGILGNPSCDSYCNYLLIFAHHWTLYCLHGTAVGHQHCLCHVHTNGNDVFCIQLEKTHAPTVSDLHSSHVHGNLTMDQQNPGFPSHATILVVSRHFTRKSCLHRMFHAWLGY